MNDFIRYLLLSAITIFSTFLIINGIERLARAVPKIGSTLTNIVKYFYVFLLIIGILYIVLYDYFNSKATEELSIVWHSFAEIAKIVLSVGAFTAAIKYISTLKVFKNQVRELILSNDFKDVIGDKLEVFAYSPEMIDKISDAHRNKLWREVTLSKYRNNFPAIYDKIEYDNDLFLKANTSFYYKHFHVFYDVALDDKNTDFVNVTYRSIYTIVRSSKDEFDWSFSTSLIKEDFDNGFSDITIKIDDNEDGVVIDKSMMKTKEEGDVVIAEIDYPLKGKTEYHVEKIHVSRQNLKKDRILGFGSKRLIDDLIVNVKFCDKLNIFFSRSNKNEYKPLYKKENEFSLENRSLLLPGDKFKLFIIKKSGTV